MNQKRRGGDDFRSEIESHIRLEADRLVEQGMPAEDALAQARRAFGNVAVAEERFYESRRWMPWHDLGRDLRYALRSMRKRPAFTLVAVLTLALGIGANTAVFSLVDAVLLRNLPVHDPRELVFLSTAGSEGTRGAPPYPCFERIRRETRSFAGIAMFAHDQLKVQVGGASPEQVLSQVASGNYFDVLGIRPALGRLMNEQDEQLDPAVAVISHSYWQRRFGMDPAAIGKTLSHRDRVFTIIGVTPPEFHGLVPGQRIEVTLPVTVAADAMRNPGRYWFQAFGRLKPGATIEQARAESDVVFKSFMADRTDISAEARQKHFDRMELPPAAKGMEYRRRRFAGPLGVLMGVVAAVLLIACVNISNLLLAQGAARRREFAIRLATGAGRGRLLRQVLAETLLLFAIGATTGFLLAMPAIRAFTAFFAQGRIPMHLDVQFDLRVAAFTAAVALLAGLIFGLLPAVSALRTDPQSAMKEGEVRMAQGRKAVHAGKLLIVAQAAVSIVLLVAAAAFVRTLSNLRNVDLGFRAGSTVTMSVEPFTSETSAAEREVVWSQLLQRIRALPFVQSASLAVLTPLSGRANINAISVPGFAPRGDSDRAVWLNHVSDGYFETFGIALVAGRTFREGDAAGAQKVVVINETAAKRYFGNRDPIGQPVQFVPTRLSDGAYTVVGVVRDDRHVKVRDAAPRFAFIPVRQPREAYGRLTLAVRSCIPEAQAAAAVAREVRALNPNILVSEIISVQEQVDSTLMAERMIATLSGIFGVLALLLSAVGLYGVISYDVAKRTPEIGIRMALGAQPASVAWGVLRQTLWLLLAGIALGIPAALLAVRTAESLLFGVKPGDPLLYLLAAAVLAMVAAATAYLPARRAAGIDPVNCLRHQ